MTEFDLRSWLLVLGPIFVLGVLVHGYWRMRRDRNILKTTLDRSFLSADTSDDLLMSGTELLNGGAGIHKIPEQTCLDLDGDEDIPVLMDAVATDAQGPELINSPELIHKTEPIDTAQADNPPVSIEPVVSKQDSCLLPEPKGPEKLVVVSVLSRGDEFSGQALLKIFHQQNMIYGEMHIFHRQDDCGGLIFSLANVVEPGTFDVEQLSAGTTPGISLFLRAHELVDPVSAFSDMVDVAQTLAEILGGELRDETRSVMTSQTIAHMQQELVQYQHKYR